MFSVPFLLLESDTYSLFRVRCERCLWDIYHGFVFIVDTLSADESHGT